MKIDKLIDPHFVKTLNIDVNLNYEMKICNSINLLTSNRVDLIQKIKFLEYKDKDYKTNFFYELYKASIETFSSGKFCEPGNKEKNTFEKYVETFNNLYMDITKNGFDINKSIFMINKNGIIDGGHRAAIAIYNKLKVPYIDIDCQFDKYTFEYFKNRFMDTELLDYSCIEYCKLKKNTYVICLWPILSLDQKNYAIDYIRKRTNIIYQKNIKFNYNGFKNFMIQIYGNQPWIGTPENHFKGISGKVDKCFKNDDSVFIVVENENVENILKIKAEIRDIMNIGNHSIHSTDNSEETINMLSILLNKNSISFLNKAEIDKYPGLYKKINYIKELARENKISLEDIVLDNEIVLEAYGLLETKKIEMINRDNEEINNNIIINTEVCKIYSTTNDNIIYNPTQYFYFEGIKFNILKNIVKREKIKNNTKLLNKINKKATKNDFKKVILLIKRKIRKNTRYIKDLIKKSKIYKKVVVKYAKKNN